MDISGDVLQRLATRKKTTDAAQRFTNVQVMMSPDWQRDMASRLNAVLAEASSAKVKIRKLYGLADRAHEKRSANVACKRGCDACCYMQVEMPDVEAEMIATAIGRPSLKLRPGLHTTPVDALGRVDTPCPFLVNHECSIYDHRPFVCRDMAVFDVDALTCSFENMHLARLDDPRAVSVPQSTIEPLKRAFKQLTMRPSSAWADIRQFFPDAAS